MEIDGIRMLIGLVIGITLLIMLVLKTDFPCPDYQHDYDWHHRRYAADANRRCGCRR